MPNAETLNLRAEVQSHGVSSRSFLDLGGAASSGLLDYLDLLKRDDDARPQARYATKPERNYP
jgi:hypothetical protein